MAARMNSDRLGMPRIASKRGSSALKVMISCFRFGSPMSDLLGTPVFNILYYPAEIRLPPAGQIG
jgi:hypothetical protein